MSTTEQDQLNIEFMKACRDAQYDKMAQLLKQGANIDVPNIKGATPLLTALAGKNEELAMWLIDRGANPTIKTNQGECPLIKASAEGMILAVKAMLKSCTKEQVNVVNNLGSTALMEACAAMHLDVVRLLLDKGADTSIKSLQGTNAMLIAAARQDPDVVELLIKKGGADPNSVDVYGVPALIAAAADRSKMEIVNPRSNSLKTVKTLLKNGANPDLKAKSGNSPLAEAGLFGNREVVIELLRHNANPNTHCATGVRGELSPLMMAALKHDRELIDLLLDKGADVNYTNSKGERALGFALYNLNPNEKEMAEAKTKEDKEKVVEKAKQLAKDTIEYLYSKGAKMGDSQKRGIAQYAVLVESKELLKMAADKGELDNPDNEGHTALHLAFYQKRQGFIAELLQLGANPNAQDEFGKTPGHMYFENPGLDPRQKQMLEMQLMGTRARKEELEKSNPVDEKKLKAVESALNQLETMQKAATEIVQRMERSLFASSMDVNKKDNDGNTVFMYALRSLAQGAFGDDLSIIDKLLEKGANPTIRNENLDSPFVLALKIGNPALIEKLVTVIKRDGPVEDIDSSVYDGAWTVSDHTAAIGFFKKGIEEAVKHGAKIDYQDEDGQTPLIVATVENKEELVTALIELGANVNLENAEGETALIQAIAQNRPNISKLLIEAGANLEHQSKDGLDAMGYAYKYQRTSVINQILEARQAAKSKAGMGM